MNIEKPLKYVTGNLFEIQYYVGFFLVTVRYHFKIYVCSSFVAHHLAAVAASRVRIPASCLDGGQTKTVGNFCFKIYFC